jgi:hypothetical protein
LSLAFAPKPPQNRRISQAKHAFYTTIVRVLDAFRASGVALFDHGKEP